MKTLRKNRQDFGILPILFILSVLLPACSVRQQTVVPKPIVSQEASFDGNVQNSGVINYDEHGFIVTPHWIERYDAMLGKFGDKFTPAVKAGDRAGVEKIDAAYRVTSQVMVRFTRMNEWRKAGQGS